MRIDQDDQYALCLKISKSRKLYGVYSETVFIIESADFNGNVYVERFNPDILNSNEEFTQ